MLSRFHVIEKLIFLNLKLFDCKLAYCDFLKDSFSQEMYKHECVQLLVASQTFDMFLMDFVCYRNFFPIEKDEKRRSDLFSPFF